MTDSQLQGLALQALNMAKTDIQHGRWRGWLLASWHEGEPLHRMIKVEADIDRRLGKDWLNNGRAKDLGFGLLRTATKLYPPGAIIFVALTNKFITTAKFAALSQEEKQRILDAGAEYYDKAVREGLYTASEALFASAQTPERVCAYSQEVLQGRFIGQPEVHFFSQTEFDGRMKFFGKGRRQAPDFTKKVVI